MPPDPQELPLPVLSLRPCSVCIHGHASNPLGTVRSGVQGRCSGLSIGDLQQDTEKQEQQEEDLSKPIAKAAPEAPQGKYRWQFFQTPTIMEVQDCSLSWESTAILAQQLDTPHFCITLSSLGRAVLQSVIFLRNLQQDKHREPKVMKLRPGGHPGQGPDAGACGRQLPGAPPARDRHLPRGRAGLRARRGSVRPGV